MKYNITDKNTGTIHNDFPLNSIQEAKQFIKDKLPEGVKYEILELHDVNGKVFTKKVIGKPAKTNKAIEDSHKLYVIDIPLGAGMKYHRVKAGSPIDALQTLVDKGIIKIKEVE